MTAKEYCLTYPATAYYSGFSGLEIHGVEYGPDNDYLYCVSGAWGGSKKYHRLKIRYTRRNGASFVVLHGYRVPLADCVRMNTVWGGGN